MEPDIDRLNQSISSMGRAHDDDSLGPDLDPDPIVQFATWMEEAIAAGLPMPNTMTLATASAEGRPSARIVLLKGFDPDGFVFFTNYESRKSEELVANPCGALVFYWSELERQVRVTGTAERVSREETAHYWSTRPKGSCLGAWASPQSREVSGRDELDRLYADVAARWADEDPPVPENWGGWRIKPLEIEFWKARSDRMHDRWLYERESLSLPWLRSRLAP